MKTMKHIIRRSIPHAVALAAFVLVSTLAQAATVDVIYTSATDVPVTANGYTAIGNTINFTLNCAPTTGTELMVVKNTGLDFIHGTFNNLTNGQPVALSYGGTNYQFVAWYYGGSGNDLVLVWAKRRAFAWGLNIFGQLGDNTKPANRLAPVAVNTTPGVSALSGKTVVAMSGGQMNSVALCSDGTVAAWGENTSSVPVAVITGTNSALHGKMVVALTAGNDYNLALCSDGSVATMPSAGGVPLAVDTGTNSALYGKTVVAIAAGNNESMGLCSDGTVATWASTGGVPMAVNTGTNSALYGKMVVAIAMGACGVHRLALCSDGTVASWGYNDSGQLGDNTTTQRGVPVAVNTVSGVSALYGKRVVAIAAGCDHSLGLCSDGTVVAWGYNGSGALGDNGTTNRLVPVAVSTAAGLSALYGKTVVGIAAGNWFSLALCSGGTVAAWGRNDTGQLGDNTTTNRLVPVMVDTTALAVGQRFTGVFSGPDAQHTLALVAAPPDRRINVTGNGLSIANGDFTPSTADGTDFGGVSLGGATAVRAFNIQNTDMAPLNLTGTPKVTVSGPQAADFSVTLQPNSPVPGGGSTTLQVTFTPSAPWGRSATLSIASDDIEQTPYHFAIQGAGSGGALSATYVTGSEVPLTTSHLTATGSTVSFTLNYAPTTGTELMVVSNTGLSFINGTFDNLTNGQPVTLSYGGTNYHFVANYYGGSGNDLVLVWAASRPFAWGHNNYGQLGDNTSSDRQVPVPVTVTGVLAGKTVVAMSAGSLHSLALCLDGKVATWGVNSFGQLGDNSTNSSLVPVPVNTVSGVSALYGKTVVAIAAGYNHSLALCSDGAVATWGYNNYGQLGDNTTTNRLVPMPVNTASGVSALYGKTVVAIAAGQYHSMALCSDGTLATWGLNARGQLGDSSTTQRRLVPVAVNSDLGISALYGKTVVAIAAGGLHCLTLCSDGTLAAWGLNASGQLGDNTTTNRRVPVAVNTDLGISALHGKTVVALAAGYVYSLALCSDSTVAAWGGVPVVVSAGTDSALYDKTVVAIAGGYGHSLARCSDSTLAAWGGNDYGQLGDNTTTTPLAPVPVDTNTLAAAQRFTHVSSGPGASHTLALVAGPPASQINLAGTRKLPDGTFQLTFTNTPGAFLGLVATTNPALPPSAWAGLGDATEVAPGQFQFTDPQATNTPQRLYRIRSP